MIGTVQARSVKGQRHMLSEQTEENREPILELPTDRPFNPSHASSIVSDALRIPPDLARELIACSADAGTGLPTLLLASLAVLLSRYTGQRRIVIGVPARGSTPPHAEVGAELPERWVDVSIDLTDGLTLRELLRHVDEAVARAVAAPGSESGPPAGRQVLFDDRATHEAPDRRWTAAQPGTVLCLALEQRGSAIEGVLAYDAARFDEATIARMAGHLQTLLAGALTSLDTPVATMPLLTPAERTQLLADWNATEATFPDAACIHTLVEDQARRTPGAVALVAGNERLTYRELDGRANRLAHRLRRLGVGPEVLVGVCLERTADLVVSLLAILKAGGAYVPLDPAYPAERIAFIIADTAAPVVLTQQRLRSRVPDSGGTVICIDTPWDAADAAAGGVAVTAENLAYIIYTSGSTGRPKGVAITHRNAVALLSWAADTFPREDLAGVLAGTSICFDLSVYEIFLPLSVGGAIILADNALHLRTLPARGEVTLVNTVPSAMAELVQTGGLPASVQTVNLAGEPLTRALAQQVYARGVRRVYNLYGPSEDTTYSTFALVERDDQREPTIGRPISNTQAYILDASLQPVPVGVTGELYLAGAGLARGYLNRPELTAERFLPNPFHHARPAPMSDRLYRTGDLARYRPDGAIEFLGRIDHQVKIRGFRIELGEIESALSRRDDVAGVVVVAREDAAGTKRLVAYIATRGAAAPGVSELRRALRETLPEYMVPAAFVFLEALPLTPNGKIDRAALPAPDLERPELDGAFVAPRTPLEQQVAALWEEVLGLRGVGVHDSFLDLGGHSLLATQIAARISRELRVETSPSLLFERPTVAELAEALAGREQRLPPAPLTRLASSQRQPLSFAQQRLWFMDQLVPNSPLYNIPCVLQIDGVLDVGTLELALGAIVRRHEALRTLVAESSGQPVQEIMPWRPVHLSVTDLRALPETERGERARRMALEHARLPLDVRRGPIFRAALIRLADETHHLLLTIHHIACDGWSAGVLMAELGALYNAFPHGGADTLPSLPVQYVDFAQWQRHRMAGEVLARQLSYWTAHLAGELPTLALPTDRPRPAAQTYRGARVRRTLPPALVESLEQLGRGARATLFMTMLAAFQALLHRSTGQTDIVVGTPLAGRTRTETEGLIGFFVNTLPVRVDLAGNPSFSELVERVRQAALGAFAHQDVPLERLIETLGVERSLSSSPLFQVVFAMQSPPPDVVMSEGLRLRFVEETDTGTAKFDLTLYVELPASGPVLIAEYNTDIFDEGTIVRLLGHYHELLAGAVASPAARLSELPLLTDAERRRLLVDWNDTAADVPGDVTVHALVEARAALDPDALALAGAGQILTYGELNQRANQLARHLRRLGVGPEVTVGVWLERGPAMVVALLAVLKAGGAYVPIDPAYPSARVAFMLADAQALVLLSQRALLAGLEGYAGATIALDGDWASVAGESAADPGGGAEAGNLAYVIYTSGSTGQPKGVPIEHRSVVNLIAWHQRAFGITAADRATQVAGPAFDASVWELWPYLTAGASVHFPAEELRTSPELMRDWLTAQRITVSFLPTPLAERVVELPWPCDTALRVLLTGGDKLQRFPPHGLPFTLVNNYGPTESTVVTTSGIVPPGDSTAAPHIGWPIANTRVYILDAHMQPAPVGVPGELYIGGAGLARGYLNRPELTAARFVPNPFHAEPAAAGTAAASRLYRTGDLARYRPDGSIEYLGRTDHQVKVRGFRIEPGEIETALGQHPAVRKAIVLAREDARGEKQLVAYVTANDQGRTTGGRQDRAESLVIGHSPLAGQLRAFLQEKLPDYMVPAAVIALAELPLTPNGKLDLRALPAPADVPPEVETYVAPRTPLEQALAAIWGQVLGVPRVGVCDDFFALGGHSLLATQVVSRLRDTFLVELPVRTMFEAPTIEQLAPALLAREARPGQVERIARLLKRLDGMSAEQITMLLQKQRSERAA